MDESTAAIHRAVFNRTDRAHIFYYPWYGNPEFDAGEYYHWNHEYLPHWDRGIVERWPKGRHKPPEDIGASFYPLLGAYSSADPSIIRRHMQWVSEAGVGVLAVSWYPPGMADGQGHSWAQLIPILLDEADRLDLKIAIHIEPYKGRTVANLKENLRLLLADYGQHRAFYRVERPDGRHLPLIYVYDSYLIAVDEWQTLLKADGKVSVRRTPLDAVFIGLLVQNEDKFNLHRAGFDGFYTYFAAERFSYGSTMANWPSLRAFAHKSGMLFIPSVGPGYDDTRVRPWNGANTRGREDGGYYERHMTAAMDAQADFISITSFNEWHEGSQIEPAAEKKSDPITVFDYKSYSTGPMQYIQLTKTLLSDFAPPTL